jgi:hypothetical protein
MVISCPSRPERSGRAGSKRRAPAWAGIQIVRFRHLYWRSPRRRIGSSVNLPFWPWSLSLPVVLIGDRLLG